MINTLSARLDRGLRRARTAWGELRDDEEGDIAGWVLIVLMTAGLVMLLWALAGPALTGLFEQAIDRVTGIG
ncbi:hypothetical protein [Microbacterium sp. gxy059]|uniref:hypothetical protein n=1 Tax=Microbacterium sp. gxy059 TaxID=2957199 RepID=UPI003D9594D9